MTPHVNLLIEGSNHFNQIFIPLAKQFQKRLLANNFSVSISTKPPSNSGRNIVFGSHIDPEKWAELTSNEDIIVNLEPLYDESFYMRNGSYIALLRARQVYDYELRNFSELHSKTKFLPVPPLNPALDIEKKREMLFVGAVTPLREKIIHDFKSLGVDVEIGFNIFGDQLFGMINQSKFFLSLDKEGVDQFNRFRFCLCAATKSLFFGQSGKHMENPEITPLIGESLFEDINDALEIFHEIRTNESRRHDLLIIQNAIADTYQDDFDLFIDKEVINDI